VIAEAADEAEAVELARRLTPDAVLLDIRMPTMDGTEGTRRRLALADHPRAFVLTTFDRNEYAHLPFPATPPVLAAR
jgi:DNA-binding NarL/FixJ family response regulator